MNKPILTIAIPTYNRAHHLDRQLDWAVRSIANRWDQLELIVSDNGSHDATPQVCARWQQQSGGQLHVFRHPRNLGLPLNALHCIQQANGQYLWLVSDDDEILDGVLDWVLHVLSSDHSKELSFILLNAMMKDKQGKVILEGVYSFINDRFENPGSSLFSRMLKTFYSSYRFNWFNLSLSNSKSSSRTLAECKRQCGVSALSRRLCGLAGRNAGSRRAIVGFY